MERIHTPRANAHPQGGRSRYRSSGWWDDLQFEEDGGSTAERLTIHEPENGPQATGLLDARGNPLYRIAERAPIGFFTLKERP